MPEERAGLAALSLAAVQRSKMGYANMPSAAPTNRLEPAPMVVAQPESLRWVLGDLDFERLVVARDADS